MSLVPERGGAANVCTITGKMASSPPAISPRRRSAPTIAPFPSSSRLIKVRDMPNGCEFQALFKKVEGMDSAYVEFPLA